MYSVTLLANGCGTVITVIVITSATFILETFISKFPFRSLFRVKISNVNSQLSK